MGGRTAALRCARLLAAPRAGPIPPLVATVSPQRGNRQLPSAPILAAWHSSVSPPTSRGAHFAEEGPSLGLAPKIPPARRILGAAVAFLSARFPPLKTCDGRVQRARRPAERAPARRTRAAARGPRPRRALRAVCGCANCPFDLLPPVPHTLVAPGDVVVVLRGCGVGPRPSVRKARREGVPSLHRQPPPWRPSLAGNHTTLL